MGLALSVIITLSDKFLFGPLIPEISNSKFTFDLRYLISAIFYGGIFEERMQRCGDNCSKGNRSFYHFMI